MYNRSLSYSRRFDALQVVKVPSIIPPKVETKDKNKALLDLIYSSCEDGLDSSSDISMFLSSKTNPQIRQFIEENLMYEQNAVGGLPMNTAQSNARMSMSDDDIALYSRNDQESVEEYSNRLNSIFSEQRRQAYFKRKFDALQKKLDSKTD